MVTRVIVGELLRRGDLLRVAVEALEDGTPGKHFALIKGTTNLIDLSDLGSEEQLIALPSDLGSTPEYLTEGSSPSESSYNLGDIDQMLLAMEKAQKLDVSDPRSRETGTILNSILDLLSRYTPQFQLHIMVFEGSDLPEGQNRVFWNNPDTHSLPWFGARERGQSVWISQPSQLPEHIRHHARIQGQDDSIEVSAAVPLYGPSPQGGGLVDRQEAGLLFVTARQSWNQDTMLRLGSRLSRFVTHRWQQHSEMNKLVHIDALTGLFNRGFFDSQFELLLERARRSNTPLTLLLGDIDHFGQVNNDYDHVVGDTALKVVAQRLQEELRRIDLICRVGGEEFALILPNTDIEAAQEVQLRLLNAPMLVQTQFEGRDIEFDINLSYGGVTFPHSGADPFELYRKADTLLFLSKDRGRNQCHFWSTDGNHVRLQPGQLN